MRLSLLRLTAAAGATAAVLAAAPRARAADAVFGGSSNISDPVVLTADPDAKELRSIGVTWRAPCADGRGFPGFSQLTAVTPVPGFAPGSDELLVSRNAKGAFAGTQLAGLDLGEAVAAVTVDFTGKLKPARATGTVHVIVKVSEKATGTAITSCELRLRWVATRAPGVIYGGATSQGEPLVIRLDAKRKRVADVVVAWRASCTPSGSLFRAPDRFVGFPLKRTGSFGVPFTDDAELPDGGKRHWDYRIGGRVTRTKAKGTLQVKVSDTDAAGVITDVCDTGNMSWKAATG